MATDLINRDREETANTGRAVSRRVTGSGRPKLSGDALISFISSCQTNIGRSTYYNLKEEQKQAMDSQHKAVFENSRFFYTLMALPNGVNDSNKQLIFLNLIRNTLRQDGLIDSQHDPVTKWENEIILQLLDNIPVTRVFDLFLTLQSERNNKKRTMNLIKRYLQFHGEQIGMWAIKYKRQMKRLLRHIHITKNDKIHIYNRYIRNGEMHNDLPKIIRDYEDVKNGESEKLARLPYTVAEGFMKKFGLSKEKFDQLFVEKGGKFTNKEKKTKSNAVLKSGVSTGLDLNKLALFDLYMHIHVTKDLPSETKIKSLIKKKAKDIARTLSFKLSNVGIIVDTSNSMYGNDTEKFHPLLKSLAISAVIQEASNGCKVYRTNGDNSIIPRLSNTSNYADSVMQALKDGCTTIVIVGDGYENAPYEGATHNLLYTYKKKLDVDNKLIVFHFNPVFASEAFDARQISNLAPQIGVKGVEGINENMFLAIAKQNPEKAIEGYARHLITLQNDKAKALMPTELKALVEDETKKNHIIENKKLIVL